MKKYKQLTTEQEKQIAERVKLLLHASRDCLRNRQINTREVQFIWNDTYCCEAFGVLQALNALEYGHFGAINNGKDGNTNLDWWFENLKQQVLQEEHFDSTHECDFCVQHYGKDGAGRTREDL